MIDSGFRSRCSVLSASRTSHRSVCGAVIAGLALAALPLEALAQTTVMGIRAQGNGCPQGSVSVLTSGDQTAILFNSFRTEVDGQSRPVSMVRCDLMLDVEMESGANLRSVDVLWQGIVVLAEGSRGTFTRGVAFPGARSVQRSQNFSEPFNAFALLDEVSGFSPAGCVAQRLPVRMNAGLMLRGAGSAEVIAADASTSFDTVKLRFGIEPCAGRGAGPPRPGFMPPPGGRGPGAMPGPGPRPGMRPPARRPGPRMAPPPPGRPAPPRFDPGSGGRRGSARGGPAPRRGGRGDRRR